MGGPPAENAEHAIIRKVRIARFGGMRLPLQIGRTRGATPLFAFLVESIEYSGKLQSLRRIRIDLL